MYSLPYFKENDEQTVLEFIHQNPFAFLVGCDENKKAVATQVPVFIEKKKGGLYLSGHIMINTDHHKAFEKNPEVLCVFSGAHSYVSATWYQDPNQASTWNYMSVHVRGQLQYLDEQGLIEVLRKTSLHFEKGNRQSPTTFDHLPADYKARLMKAIVAFEISVSSVENVFKLSQNRDEKSYQNIIDKLAQEGGDGKRIAVEMGKRKSELFQR